MLVISRKPGESVTLGEDTVVTVLGTKQDQVRLGIAAPRDVPVVRSELLAEVRDRNLAATRVEQDALRALGRSLRPESHRGGDGLAALRRMARRIGHDLRNILTGIRGEADLALLDCEQDSMRESLQAILEYSARLGREADSLAQFCHGSSPGCDELLLVEVLEEVVSRCAAPGLRLALHCSPELTLVGGRESLVETLQRLVRNAIEAMGGTGSLELGARELESEGLQLWVKDEGHGIDSATLRHMFEPFFTTRQGHVGMGLSVVDGWCRSQGASIAVDSQVGEGTTVTLELPRRPRPDPEGSECILLVGELDSPAHVRLERAGYRVLVVDDLAQASCLASAGLASILACHGPLPDPPAGISQVVDAGADASLLRKALRALPD